jgi:uncharacterized membrane-anchored protein
MRPRRPFPFSASTFGAIHLQRGTWVALAATASQLNDYVNCYNHVRKRNSQRMKDLRNPRLIWFKGILFLVIGLLSAGLLWMETPTLKGAGLLALTIWGFCRAYYFAFYVLEKYVDARFRFAGLGSFLLYLLHHRKNRV